MLMVLGITTQATYWRNELNKRLAETKAISLFSGIGGFEYGMNKLKFKFMANLEFDKDCVVTLNSNDETACGRTIQPLDITEVSPADFYDGEVDYIVGGPPCQSFSAAGRRAGGVPGMDDARGTLFWYYCQYVNHFKPKAFVFENVRGILSSKAGADFEIICRSFNEVGYNLFWRVLNSADYGVPQLRERLYLVGIREDLQTNFRFPRPTHGPDSELRTNYVTALDAIGDLDEPDVAVPEYGGKYGHLIPEIPEGENYRHFTEEMGHPNPQFAWRSKFSGFLYKMARNEPCRTIVSQQSRYDGPLHWRNRKCTSAELKRLQGFPDHLLMPHSNVTAVKQIGNSVTPPVATALGKALRYQIEGIEDFAISLLEPSEKLTFDSRKGGRARLSREKKVKTITSFNSPGLFDEEAKISLKLFKSPSITSSIFGYDIKAYKESHDRGFEIEGSDKFDDSSWFVLDLAFVGDFSDKIKSVSVRGFHIHDSETALRLAWKLINELVRENSSYESLQPLWGHFTEPYPKFRLLFDSSADELAYRIQKFVIDRHTRKELVSYKDIVKQVDRIERVLEVSRSIGLDVRTSATNRTISEGFARFCYPFGLYSS